MSLVSEMYQTGFTEGIAYVFSHISQDKFIEYDLERLAGDLATRFQWKTANEWLELIKRNYIHMTEADYERNRQEWLRHIEESKDKPVVLRHFQWRLKQLDQYWQRIKRKGVY